MFFFDKDQRSATPEQSGPGFSSVPEDSPGEVARPGVESGSGHSPSLRQDFRKQDCTPELHGLIDTLQDQRKKILANVVVAGWVSWDTWILCGLLIVLAISVRLALGTILALALSILGAAFIIAWAWRARISTYQTAQRLDTAADLQDRTSTAIYLGDLHDPVEMIARQRKDALSRLAKLDLSKLFPLQIPKTARRGAALLLAVVLLFAYRMHHRPPVVALLQTMARSPLVQSIIAPLVNALEKDLERAAALVTAKPDSLADQSIPAMADANSDLWQSGNDKAGDAKDAQQDSLDASAGDMPDDQTQPGDQNQQSSDSRQLENSADQSQDAGNSGDTSSDQAQKQSDSRGSQKPGESLSQSLMQALKNMMSKSPSQQNNRDNKAPNSDGAPQSGNSNQSGNNDSDKKGDSHGTSDARDKQSQSASSGAGSQPGLKELRPNQNARQVQAIPDRVALEASGFKEQTRMRVDTETGTSQLALRDQQSQSEAIINGAEEENIPPRYRLYVQRYFEHADTQKR